MSVLLSGGSDAAGSTTLPTRLITWSGRDAGTYVCEINNRNQKNNISSKATINNSSLNYGVNCLL